MTAVKIFRKNGAIVRVKANGHSGYAEQGSDIVCAAVSSILITAYNGCERVAGVKPGCVERDGMLEFWLPDAMTQEQRLACTHILEAMALGIKDLVTEYQRYVKSEEIRL
jgi:hypothetical protein